MGTYTQRVKRKEGGGSFWHYSPVTKLTERCTGNCKYGQNEKDIDVNGQPFDVLHASSEKELKAKVEAYETREAIKLTGGVFGTQKRKGAAVSEPEPIVEGPTPIDGVWKSPNGTTWTIEEKEAPNERNAHQAHIAITADGPDVEHPLKERVDVKDRERVEWLKRGIELGHSFETIALNRLKAIRTYEKSIKNNEDVLERNLQKARGMFGLSKGQEKFLKGQENNILKLKREKYKLQDAEAADKRAVAELEEKHAAGELTLPDLTPRDESWADEYQYDSSLVNNDGIKDYGAFKDREYSTDSFYDPETGEVDNKKAWYFAAKRAGVEWTDDHEAVSPLPLKSRIDGRVEGVNWNQSNMERFRREAAEVQQRIDSGELDPETPAELPIDNDRRTVTVKPRVLIESLNTVADIESNRKNYYPTMRAVISPEYTAGAPKKNMKAAKAVSSEDMLNKVQPDFYTKPNASKETLFSGYKNKKPYVVSDKKPGTEEGFSPLAASENYVQNKDVFKQALGKNSDDYFAGSVKRDIKTVFYEENVELVADEDGGPRFVAYKGKFCETQEDADTFNNLPFDWQKGMLMEDDDD